MVWTILGDHPGSAVAAGAAGETFPEPLHLAADGAHRRSHQRRVPLASPWFRRPDARASGHSGSQHLGTAKNDHDAVSKRTTTATGTNDDVDDACDVRLYCINGSQRLSRILDRIQHNSHGYPIFRNRMGRTRDYVPKARTSSSCGWR